MPYQSFEESQRFGQIWLWIVIIGVSIVMIVQVPLDIIQQSGSEPMSTTNSIILVFSVVFVIGINVLFFAARLKTKINNDGVYITFPPFFSKPKSFSWNEIKEAYVRKYRPLWEYGGWGIRIRWNSRAYNTSGNMGLQLIMKDGKKILIGTHKPDELDAFLKKSIFAKNQDKY
jgi:hypothetical protein